MTTTYTSTLPTLPWVVDDNVDDPEHPVYTVRIYPDLGALRVRWEAFYGWGLDQASTFWLWEALIPGGFTTPEAAKAAAAYFVQRFREARREAWRREDRSQPVRMEALLALEDHLRTVPEYSRGY